MKKVLIANRGEIAIRIARTCSDLGLKTVGIYSEDDSNSLHLSKVDEAFKIEGNGAQAYLNIKEIIAVAKKSKVDAIHPGYGFLSENEQFSKICLENKIKFIGASAEMIKNMGDKANAKSTMKKAGVPVIPGSDGIIETLEEAKAIKNKEIVDALELPPIKIHCSVLAEDSIKQAIEDYESKQ